jgi:hypothetical protein
MNFSDSFQLALTPVAEVAQSIEPNEKHDSISGSPSPPTVWTSESETAYDSASSGDPGGINHNSHAPFKLAHMTAE